MVIVGQQRVNTIPLSLTSGGSDGSEYLDTVECYDPSKLNWDIVTKLPSPRFGAAAIVLSKGDHIDL